MSDFTQKLDEAKEELKVAIKDTFTTRLDELVESKKQEKYGAVEEEEEENTEGDGESEEGDEGEPEEGDDESEKETEEKE